ncbi:MAG: membrane protein insertion efficiency factor YidD, partial [Acidimicrobiales bacterium]
LAARQGGFVSATATTPEPTLSPVGRALVTLVRGYQVVRLGRVSPCRFTPSCSEFAVEAITRHGPRHGVSLVARRLVRCRPGGPFGFDPVPD